MKYVLLLIFCALVFLVCFLVDRLLQKLFPKHELEKSKSVVRPPQKSATFGVLLVFIPLMALLFLMPEGGDTLLTICCVGAMIMGAFLLYTYFPSRFIMERTAFSIKRCAAAKKNTATRTSGASGAS